MAAIHKRNVTVFLDGASFDALGVDVVTGAEPRVRFSAFVDAALDVPFRPGERRRLLIEGLDADEVVSADVVVDSIVFSSHVGAVSTVSVEATIVGAFRRRSSQARQEQRPAPRPQPRQEPPQKFRRAIALDGDLRV